MGGVLVSVYAGVVDEFTHGGELERVDFNTECGDVLLLELARQVALNEGGLRTLSYQLCTLRVMPYDSIVLQCIHTFPVPPSPTSTSLKVGTCCASAILFVWVVFRLRFAVTCTA